MVIPLSLMLPLPEASKPEVPLVPTAVQVSEVTIAGKVSVTVAPTTLDGPPLLTVMVYVVGLPEVCVALPSVLVIGRSDRKVGVSVSVALLLPGTLSKTADETVAV